LRFGFFGTESGNFFEAADMLFLMLFEFGTLEVNQLDLTVQIFLDRIIFLGLLV